VAAEIEKASSGIFPSRYLVIEVFPDPEGAVRMMIFLYFGIQGDLAVQISTYAAYKKRREAKE
jgi:hypothetical protein